MIRSCFPALTGAFLLLSACVTPTDAPPVQAEAPRPETTLNADIAARNFIAVVQRMEPVAERECRARLPGRNCDFHIVVDDRKNLPPNAFQTLDRSGRPVIGFTIALIAQAQNRDELAFILGHEAAHHIAGHLQRQRQSATGGAILGALIGAAIGVDVNTTQEIGATVGARRYSKDFELEADRLGTIITHRGGYDPVRGSLYFNRIADPGNRFLGTHPPNADRLRIVRETAAQL